MTAPAYEPAISPSKLDGCINTLSGKKFDFIRPSAEMIDIQDIASGLAYKGHFAGQTSYMFSIAQHSIMVCDEFCLQEPDASDEMKLMALLHDASEAYTGDMPKPLKVFMDNFVSLENTIMHAIGRRFNLPIHLMHLIKPIDLKVQNIEYDAFFRGGTINYLDPETARKVFLDRFNEYYHS